MDQDWNFYSFFFRKKDSTMLGLKLSITSWLDDFTFLEVGKSDSKMDVLTVHLVVKKYAA